VTNPAASKKNNLASASGAALAVLAGLALWLMPLGDAWINSSYDYLFRFGNHAATNQVTLILMDNESFAQLHQARGQPWDRALHARLLNRLADDGCALVVMDSFFREPRDPESDDALAAAMRRQRHLVLMAEQSQVTHPDLAGAQPTLPDEKFLSAAGTNWGVAWLDPDLDNIVRRQWPYPSPGPYPSLPWVAARLAGASLSAEPQERWLRYYGQNGTWKRLGYAFASAQPAGYFRNQIVFIGTQPKTSLPDGETDEFSTPYARWTHESSGGVEILVTAFQNLVNHDWLQRPAWWVELFLFSTAGIFLGGGLCRLRRLPALAVAGVVFFAVALSAVWLSFYTDFWYPWLIIAGGQLPCALAWALATGSRRVPDLGKTAVMEILPDTPGYEIFQPPFAEGAYGKVWLARNAAGQWRALKVIYLAKFDNHPDPYEREFKGIQKYKPVSDQHPGLLRVDFVSPKKAGCFYYVMELGDALEPGWQQAPATYRPRDLVSERARLPRRRLPVKECLRIGIILTEALEFLHRQGMTHRDIKPQNIIYVDGKPKLADLGLITEIRPADQARTLVGTPGYMPPPPERPGTVAADLYALGMVLYVVVTGRAPTAFPEIATTLVDTTEPPEFFILNPVILKACQPVPADRYASAAEMRLALEAARTELENGRAGPAGALMP
jgi:CHASE2 domain-containing sensor protein